MLEIPSEVIEHKLAIDSSYKSGNRKKKDRHQRGEKPSSKKLINYSKSGLLGQTLLL
jgi:hypothetical protein